MTTTYDNAKLIAGTTLPHRVWRKEDGGRLRTLFVNRRWTAEIERTSDGYVLHKGGTSTNFPRSIVGFRAAVEEALA